MGEIEYKSLRDLMREEKSQPSLVSLPEDFHSSVEKFLNSKFSEMESTRSVLQMREFENAVATIREICLIRQQKILFKAIRNGGEHSATPDMTREEHELYDRFCGIVEEERGRLDGMLSRFESKRAAAKPAERKPAAAFHGEDGARKAEIAPQSAKMASGEATVDAGSGTLKRVRFLKDVPAYKGANSQTFGPYKPGEEGKLPFDEADWLLKGKLAEALE
ncbi:Uncharacterised protein [uncultured archaeon]|nr:Uncharacterised protein [uncultured archaeon]